MGVKRHSPEEIIQKLREAEVEQGRGKKLPEVCREIGVTGHPYLRWRNEYGGLRVDPARRRKELESETGRLKKLLAEAEGDQAIRREAARPNV
jgi:transposase-like protein